MPVESITLTTDDTTHCDTGPHVGIPVIQPLVSVDTQCDLYLGKNDTHALGAAIESHPVTTEIVEQVAVQIGAWACVALAKSDKAELPCEIVLEIAVKHTVDVVIRAYHRGSCVKLSISWRNVPDPMFTGVDVSETSDRQFCR